MTPSPNRALAGIALGLAITLAALCGCASVQPGNVVTDGRPDAKSAAPVATPDYSNALRCMDTLLLDYGARDMSVMVEGLADPTQRDGSVAKDLLIAAVSDMTQRSRAIRLVASGKDWADTANYLSKTQTRDQVAIVPTYALRGSVTQLDKASPVELGVDLTLLSTHDMSVVPGVAARAAIVRSGDGGVEIRNFGVGYRVPARNRGEAMRSAVDAATIELFGRLAKVPYWTCLGVSDANETVAAEVQDWYDAMAARPAEIIRYFQGQLHLRRVYGGPVDGAVNPDLKQAVARYREVLGLSREPKLSLDFFKAYLRADHHSLEARLHAVVATANPVATSSTPDRPAVTAAPATVPVAATQPAAATRPPLALRVTAIDGADRFARGEPVQLMIRTNRDAHVYCYLQDESRKIVRFFPNRFQQDSRVQADQGLRLPGEMRFEIVVNARGALQTVSCLATEDDVLPRLPASVGRGDFNPLPVASLDQVRGAFAEATGGALAQQSFELRSR